jgi:uncharacterized membrane protein YcaP (DUF421 family)
MNDAFRQLIGPDGEANPAQMCVRAVILFVIGLIYIRIAGRRTFSQATPLDIIVALIVGSNISRIMTGRASFYGGLSATLVLVVLHRLLAMATLRWGWLSKFLKSDPVVLVRDGATDERAMRRHGIADCDLEESIRLENAERVQDVKLAMLEPSGKISVVRKKGG